MIGLGISGPGLPIAISLPSEKDGCSVQVVCGLSQLLLQGAGCTPGIVAGSLPDLLLHLGVIHDLGRPKRENPVEGRIEST